MNEESLNKPKVSLTVSFTIIIVFLLIIFLLLKVGLAHIQNKGVTYEMMKSDDPTLDEEDAYKRIVQIMDSATYIYNSNVGVRKKIKVYYVTDSTVRADGNFNGNIRFGPDRSYMTLGVAIHEISHTIGVGSKESWFRFGNYSDSLKYAIYPQGNATKVLREITGDSISVIYRDNQHFWPFGLNYVTEYKSESDLINHCKLVNAMLKDGL